jgi:hypothetical protein
MENVIIIAILIAIIGSAAFYVYKTKKNGKKCIGCPNSCGCSGQNGQGGCCGCSGCCK